MKRAILAAALSALCGCNNFDKDLAKCLASNHCFSPNTSPLLVADQCYPPNGTQGVSPESQVSLKFTEAMDKSTVSVSFTPDVDAGVGTWSESDSRLTFEGATGRFDAGTQYALTVTGSDLAGNPLLGTNTLSFTTVAPPDTTPPSVVATTPQSNGTNFPVNSNLTFTFSEPMAPAITTGLVTLSPGGIACVLSWSNDNTLLTCHPNATLQGGATYTVTLTSGLTDASGNPLAPYTYTFQTATVPDTTPPTFVSSTPDDNAIGAPQSPSITLTFSEAMDKASVQTAFSIYSTSPSYCCSITYNYSWSADSTQVTITTNATFYYGMQIYWTVPAGVAKDLAGNGIGSTTQRSFRIVRTGNVHIYGTASNDGYIYQDPTSGNTTYVGGAYGYAGDVSTNYTYRSFFSFDLSYIPATATAITDAYLYIYLNQVIGNPYAGTPTIDSVAYGDLSSSAYFTGTQTQWCISFPYYHCQYDSYNFSTSTTPGYKSTTVTSGVSKDLANRASNGNRSEFRLRIFPDLSNNSASDYIQVLMSESSSNQPYIVIDYEYP